MGRPISLPTKQTATKSDDDEGQSFDASTHTVTEFDTKNRTIFLAGDITEASAVGIISKLVMLSQLDSRPIRMVISTYGGSLDESLAIYDTMKLIRAPVHTVGIGKIMSAGVLLLAAGKKGERIIGARSRVMIHNAWGGFVGDPFELKNELAEFERLETLESECLLSETTLTKAQLQKILTSRLDRYITPEQAIGYGIADKLSR